MFSPSTRSIQDGGSHVDSQFGTPLGSPNSADNRSLLSPITPQIDGDEAALKQRLQHHEEFFGPEHTSTIDVVHELGSFYMSSGRLDDAEAMFARELGVSQQATGAEDVPTLNATASLAALYEKQGRSDGAEAMYRRALRGYDKTLGPEHASTLTTARDLGRLYKAQGRHGEAEAMFKRVIGGLETNSKPDRTSANDPLYDSGRPSQGQTHLDLAATASKRTLDHSAPIPELNQLLTITTVDDLGSLYADQGRLEEAEQLYRSVNHAM